MGGLRYATQRCGCICVASVSSGALGPFTPVDPHLRDRASAIANNRDRTRVYRRSYHIPRSIPSPSAFALALDGWAWAWRFMNEVRVNLIKTAKKKKKKKKKNLKLHERVFQRWSRSSIINDSSA